MQRPLLVLACATSVAVGSLCAVTVTAYASPVTGGSIVSAPALVVPADYRPANFAVSRVTVLSDGVTQVAPGPAVELDGGNDSPSSDGSAPESGDQTGSGTPGAPVPSTAPTSTPSPSSKTNSGNDLKNKGDGSNKNKTKVK